MRNHKRRKPTLRELSNGGVLNGITEQIRESLGTPDSATLFSYQENMSPL